MPGVDFDGQARLHALTAVLATDASEMADAAAECCARYLVGAGVGTLASTAAWARDLYALDPQLRLAVLGDDIQPPVAHFWITLRPYGAAVDLQIWDGDALPRSTTWRLELGQPATPAESVAIGAAAAELLLGDVLGVSPLPSRVEVDWTDGDGPLTSSVERAVTPPPQIVGSPMGSKFLAQLRALPAVWDTVTAAAEQGYPLETCGLVLRRGDGTLYAQVCPNVQDRYHGVDPAAFPRTSRNAFRLDERSILNAEAAGETLVALWHSHTDAGAYFSAEDVHGAAPDGQPLYSDATYLVVSVRNGSLCDAALFCWDPQARTFASAP